MLAMTEERQHEEGALLIYSSQYGHWEGETPEHAAIWVTTQVFQAHVLAYLHAHGITAPTSEQRGHAQQVVRRVTYWRGCTYPEVRVKGFGHFVGAEHAFHRTPPCEPHWEP